MPLNKTFQEFDKCSLKEFSELLEKIILAEQPFTEGALVISLNGTFGSGKSTFLEMWRNELTSNKPQIFPMILSLNAWESDFCGHPFLSIMGAFASVLEESSSSSARPVDAKRVLEAAKSLGRVFLNVGNQLIDNATGIDPAEAIRAGRKKETSPPLKIDAITWYNTQVEKLKELRSALEAYFQTGEARVLILVDELDRCRPDYAIHYLETIKHIFDIQGLTFVLAVDPDQLSASAKALFGQNLNFPEYYRKFVSWQIALPSLSTSEESRIVDHFLGHFMRSTARKRQSSIKIHDLSSITRETFARVGATPRQIRDALNLLGHVTHSESQGIDYRAAHCWLIMGILSTTDPPVFHALGNQTFSPEELFSAAKKFVPKGRDEIMRLLLLSYWASPDEILHDTVAPLFGKYGFKPVDLTQLNGLFVALNKDGFFRARQESLLRAIYVALQSARRVF
ncbi:MAG TPA: P-loop NTPase fold protein [Verrucomicrobiales bacterium]|nr:P-loop NTPase fold protein [Verrucomicrobiales bacterium]